MTFRAPMGTRDVLPPESDRWQALVARFADARDACRVSACSSRRCSSTSRSCRSSGRARTSCARSCTTSTDKGGRALALRADGTASVVRAFVQHRPLAAVEGLVRRAELPLRTTTDGAVPPALAGRRRGARRRRPGVDVEVDRARARLLPRARAEAVPAARELDGRRCEPRALPRRLARRTGATTRISSATRLARAEANPLRILDSKRDDWADLLERAPQIGEYLSAEAADAVRTGARGPAGARRRSSRSRRGSCAGSTTTPARRSSSRATRSTPRRTRSVAAGATTASPRTWADPRPPGIGFGIGIERVLHRLRRGRRVRRAEPRVSTCSSSTAVGGTEASVLIEELRAVGMRADRAVRRPRVPQADGRRRQVRRALRRRSSVPRRSPTGKVGVKDLTSGDQIDVRRDEAAA